MANAKDYPMSTTIKTILAISATIAILSLTSCATIINGTEAKVNVSSIEPNTFFDIRDKDTNTEVQAGVTPATVKLKRADGYFSGKEYIVTYSNQDKTKHNVQYIEPSLSAWYFGDIILGGWILGGLIIDPIMGGMWTYPDNLMLSPDTLNLN